MMMMIIVKIGKIIINVKLNINHDIQSYFSELKKKRKKPYQLKKQDAVGTWEFCLQFYQYVARKNFPYFF